jgi:hypothetical protein
LDSFVIINRGICYYILPLLINSFANSGYYLPSRISAMHFAVSIKSLFDSIFSSNIPFLSHRNPFVYPSIEKLLYFGYSLCWVYDFRWSLILLN